MEKKGGRGKRQRKDNQDPNKRPAKRTKTQKNEEGLFYTLHDELIINVLVQIPMKYFPDLARTCKRWSHLSQKQDFWRLYAIRQWGPNILPNQLIKSTTGSVEVDLSKHLIPTIQIGGQQVVDWFRYCKIRILFAHVKKGLKQNHNYELEDDWNDLFDDGIDDDYEFGDYDYDLQSLEDYFGDEPDMYSEEQEELQNLLDDLRNPDLDDLNEIDQAEISMNRNNNNNANQTNNNNDTSNNKKNFIDFTDEKELEKLSELFNSASMDEEEESFNDYDDDEESFREAVQELVDQHKRETDSHENQANFELTNENVKNFIVDLPINPGFDFSQPHYLPKVLFEFLYELLPMVFGASNLSMTSKHMTEAFKNVCDYLEEKGERFAEKYYERMLVVQSKTKQMFDMFMCSCKMFLQLKGADERKKILFKKLLQTMLDIIPLLLNFDIELELKDLLKNEFTPEEANQEDVVGQLIPEIRNALRSTRSLHDKLPKTCDMTKFRYPSREIAERSLTSKDPIATIITPNSKDYAIFNEILGHFIIDKFISVDDLNVKAAALALLDVSLQRTYELCTSVLPIIFEATQHDYEEISFAGFVALHKFSTDKEIVQKLTKKQVTMAIEAVVRGIAKFPHSTFYLVNILVRLLKNRGEYMSDKLFDEFNERLLNMIIDQPKVVLNPIVSKEAKIFERFWKLGLVFKERLEKYLPKYREALLQLASTKFETSVVIANIEAHPSVIPEEQRLIQYVLLGNACLGEKFNAEAEDFVKYLQKQKKIKIGKDAFNALFGDILCRINQKNNKKLKEILKNILDSFSLDLYDFGIRPAVERYTTIGEDWQTFKTIPYTYKQFQDAVKVFKAKKGRRSGKNMVLEKMFEYEPPTVKKDKKIKKSDKVRYELNNLGTDGYSSYFGLTYTNRPNVKKEITSLGGTIAVKNMLLVLECTTDEDLLDLQRAFHVILAFLRDGAAPASYFEVAMKLFAKLKPDLVREIQMRYMQIMALVISVRIDSKEKMTDELKQVLLSIYDQLIAFYEENLDDRHMIEFLLTFAVRYQDQFPNEKNMMVYNLLKRLVFASPKDTRRALMYCHAVGKFFVEPPNDDSRNPWFIERMHIIAFIGYHFGPSFLNRISHFRAHTAEMTFNATEMFSKCVEYYKSAEEMDPELQNLMKRFIVLFAVFTTTDIHNLCLYNALFSEEAARVMAVVRSKKFDTGIKDLNKEAKSWDNIFDL